MGQCADTGPGGERVLDNIDAVDRGGPLVRLQHGVKNPKRRRLAGTVRPQQPGDLSIIGVKRHTANGFHVTKGFFQSVDPDHGDGPEKSTKKGIEKTRSRQPVSSPSTLALATKSPMMSGVQPRTASP